MDLDDDMTEEELEKLASVGTDEQQRAVAKHPNTSLRTLRYLAEMGFAEDVDQNPLLLFHLEAGHPEANRILQCIAVRGQRPERLAELSQHARYSIRSCVACNPVTLPITLASLAKDTSREVRRNVAKNVHTPPEVLAQMAEDISMDPIDGVSENPSCPVDILVRLSCHQVEDIRAGVAMNASTPETILHVLAKDESSYVRRYLTLNDNLPLDLFEALKKDPDDEVRRQAALIQKRNLASKAFEPLRQKDVLFLKFVLEDNYSERDTLVVASVKSVSIGK